MRGKPRVKVRRMTEADIPACVDIMVSTSLWQRYDVSKEGATRRFQEGLAREAVIFVAEVEGEVVGFVWCEARGAFARSGYIPLVGVSPRHRGRGIGTALMDRAEAFLATVSQDVFLLVADFNEAAQRFYRRRGYVHVGSLSDYIVPGVTEYIYRKRLT